ncbi:MAG: phosphopantetheine-binding protein [Pseudomonadota bacterium]
MSDVSQKVREIIAEQALVTAAEVKDTQTLEDLGIDSLGLVEAVFAIEEAFDIQVPFNANDPTDSEFDITNVESMIAAVEKLVATKD